MRFTPGFYSSLRAASVIALALVLLSAVAAGQTTIATGSLQGTVTDQTGAVVPNATITIVNRATGQTVKLLSSGTGTYSSGALIPGEYVVKISAPTFATSEFSVAVQVGVTSHGSVTLKPGAETTVLQVPAETAQVNTEQAIVGSVVTQQQIDTLPIGGRNFLDLAQLAPGVQIQDAGNFMPTKEGFSSVSFQGRTGQNARIELDGIDVSDETFGTTTQNIPASGIAEFQLSQSSLDLSQELTSTGAVNVVTRSGTNVWHGEAFAIARFHNTAAKIAPKDVFWRRQQYGAHVGGPLIKDKLFLFVGVERPKQDLFFPVVPLAPFEALAGGFNSPFREQEYFGRLDWQFRQNYHLFYRFSYDQLSITTASPNTFQAFNNFSHAPVHAAGLDFNTGSFSHSVRFGYTRFWDNVTDATNNASIFNAAPGISLIIGFDPNCVPGAPDFFCSGASLVAPQYAAQRNHQIRYDGSKTFRSHIFRYGVDFNAIRSLVVAALGGTQPIVLSPLLPQTIAFADAVGPFPGGSTNPANYPVVVVAMGNRAGFFTEVPRFGRPGGGVEDNRFAWYVGDSWKIKPTFTLTYGLRYNRDTGRTDSDLPPIPVLDRWGPGLGARVRQPNTNFAPQVGFAWSLGKSGDTVIRAGGGLFYDNLVHSNVVFDRSLRLEKGILQNVYFMCPGPLRLPDGTTAPGSAGLCFQPAGVVAQQIYELQNQVAAQTLALGPQANPGFIGTTLSNQGNLFAPDYRSQRSWQVNLGVQRRLGKAGVISVDYLRNIGLHFLLAQDTNHIGDARYLNLNAAINAIAAVNASLGCAPGPSGIDCAIAAAPAVLGRPLSISDYAGRGLDTTTALFPGGSPSVLFGVPPDFGAAFAGIDPTLGPNAMLFSQGRSVYNGMQVTYNVNLTSPIRGLKTLNLQASYSLSRFVSQAANQDFTPGARDNRDPFRFTGPVALDRTHQFSVGATVEFPYSIRASVITHVQSPRPVTLSLPTTGVPGEIFRTDWTGDGTTGDIVPGGNVGAFGRDVHLDGLNGFINAYNSTHAGTLTPAGQALVDKNLFTQAQLVALDAVMPTIQAPPDGEVGVSWLRTVDLKLAYAARIHERFSIEPSVSFYNLFNFSNFDGVSGTISGVLNGLPGSLNGTTPANRGNRVTFGSGTFAFGAPRAIEWGIRFTF